jgi:LPXTG-motif cell wall-anchored protein
VSGLPMNVLIMLGLAALAIIVAGASLKKKRRQR